MLVHLRNRSAKTINSTCCHTEIEVADQTFYLAKSQYTDTGPYSEKPLPPTCPVAKSTRDAKERETSKYWETIHRSSRAAGGPFTGTDTDIDAISMTDGDGETL